MPKVNSAAEAVACIKSQNRVFIHGGCATPHVLVQALVEQHDRLRDVELTHIHVEGPAPYALPEYAKSFRVANLFVGGNMRSQLDYERVDFIPIFLSEIPQLFRSGRRPIDVALIHVSPPNKSGYCSLGISVDVARAAVDTAKIIVAQVNPRMPFVHGDGFIHIDDIDYWVEVNEPLCTVKKAQLTEAEKEIGKKVASLIDDGATLQIGIGSIPDAVLASLTTHRDLGVHTEMWAPGLLPLLKSGVVNNCQKSVHPGKTVSGFILGTEEVYQFIDDNPSTVQLDIQYVNDPHVIRRNPKVAAINSAVEVDITGQVCADSIGPKIISGFGGQMDFMRGASLSPGGKPIIAITSRSKKGVPRIVPLLKSGAGVTTTRGHVHWVVTEYGIADLFGKTLGERARALIDIAHPDDRESLDRQRHEIFKKAKSSDRE